MAANGYPKIPLKSWRTLARGRLGAVNSLHAVQRGSPPPDVEPQSARDDVVSPLFGDWV